MSGTGQEIITYTIDTSELERIASENLQLSQQLYDFASIQANKAESIGVCVLVLLGSLLGALIFRHLRK